MSAPVDGRRVNGENVAFIDNAGIVTELFGSAIIVQETVVFPLDVMELGEDVARDTGVATEFVGEEAEAPTNVPVAVERADTAVFAINERLRMLLEAIDVVERGTGVSGA